MRNHYRMNFQPKRTLHLPPWLKTILLCLLPALCGGGIMLWAHLLPPATVERLYSQSAFPAISSVFRLLGRLGRFSMAEVLLGLLALVLLTVLIALPILLLISKGQRARLLFSYLCGLLALPGTILLLFALTCAPNYNRLSFAEQSGLVVKDASVEELAALCTSLIAQTNAAREPLGEAAVLDRPFSVTADQTREAFNTLTRQYPFLGEAKLSAKPVGRSQIMSSFTITGFYFPYTAEANVNVAMPDIELPFTIAHELAHTVGMMSEDEANYLAYLACLQSDDPYLRYSGLYGALAHSMNALGSADIARYYALRETYHPLLTADAALLSAYWQPYWDTPSAKVSEQVNDTYLKVNQIDDGLQSYGRMVDLLLAEARAKQ